MYAYFKNIMIYCTSDTDWYTYTQVQTCDIINGSSFTHVPFAVWEWSTAIRCQTALDTGASP